MQRGTALVTGSSSGFGLLTCVALAARGFKVWASMRDTERAGPLRAALEASGFGTARVEIVALDITDAAQTHAVVERILAADGAVDVLVNNAGIMLTGFAEDIDEAALRNQFETNFFGLVRLTRALLPAMRERRYGKVINLSSVSGRRALPDHSAYCASKFALEGWSEALRFEMIPYNVFVSLVEPGMFPATGIFERGVGAGAGAGAAADTVHSKSRAALSRAAAKLQKLFMRADPQTVADVVAGIALADQPRLRYPVGLDAWASALSFGPAVQTWWEQYMVQVFRE